MSTNCFVRRGYHIPLLLTGYLSQLICKAASGLKSQHIIARQDASLNHHFVCYLYSISQLLMGINYANLSEDDGVCPTLWHSNGD